MYEETNEEPTAEPTAEIPLEKTEESMIKFIVTLKSGGDYTPDNAIALATQVSRHLSLPHDFICMTDMQIDSSLVTSIPLVSELKGWWAVLEIFRNSGPCISTGLDSIIMKDISRVGELCLTCEEDMFYMVRPQPRSLRRGVKLSSGIMIWNGDWNWIYDKFMENPMLMIHKFRGEQAYTAWQLTKKGIDVRLVQDYFDGFYSYKNDCRGPSGVPDDATWIGFHGKPRPHKCEEKWIKDIYNDRSVPEHLLAKMAENERLQQV